jgi:tetratricopeptide (TPR) repeat protein
MMRFPNTLPGLLALALLIGLAAAPGTGWMIQSAWAQEGAVRPEIGKPLQAARDLMKAGKAREALAKISETDNVPGKTANESHLINSYRFSAANAAGDNESAARAYEALVSSGRMSAAEQAKSAEALAYGYARVRDFPKAIQWASRALKDNPGNTQLRTQLAQFYFQNNECGKAIGELQGMVQAEASSGRPPSESQLEMMANCYSKQKDNNGYLSVLEKQLTYYPKKEYWFEALNKLQRKQGYAGRLDLDVDRLKMATGGLRNANDIMEMAQLALQAGAASEAKKIVDQAFAAGMLGTGAEADRQKRLRDLAAKTVTEAQQSMAAREAEASAAKDGQLTVTLGYEYATSGQAAKGIAMMEQGIKKDSLKYPDDAKLHLGEAMYAAGQKAKAIEVFRTVKGTDGTGDLARLWVIQSGR